MNITKTIIGVAATLIFAAAPVFVYASTSVSIQSLSPSTNVGVGTNISFTVASSGFSNPTYTVSDSFSGSSVSGNDINSSGNFSWTPTQNDVGTHNITIIVNDSQNNNATVEEQIIVGSQGSAQSQAIQGFTSGSSVVVGTPVSFTVSAPGFNNPVFTVQDPLADTSITSSDINSAGYFTWTPTTNDVGTHSITIYINDSSGHSANIPVSIVVAVPHITITSITPGVTVTPNNQLSFTLSQAGFVNPTYSVSDSFNGTAATTITNADITSSGDFTWTPVTNQTGTHVITVTATDSAGHSANTSITVNVNSGVSLALTAPAPSASIAAGTTVVFNSDAFGFINPSFTVQDSFSGSTSITNANINSSGYFSWTPKPTDAGVHTIVVTANDTYSHIATAQATITVAGSSVPTTPAPVTATPTPAPVVTPSPAPAASSAVTFTDYLYPGLQSDQVTALQQVLTAQGDFSGPITGYFGDLTQAAVEQFQGAQGLDQIGVVGPATRAALNQLSASGTATTATTNTSASGNYDFENFLDVGSTGADVTALQNKLTALGIYSGPITGYFGGLTQAAVEQFQTAQGISSVGYVGPATRAALNQ